MIEKGFPDFHRSNLCKFSSSIHILISRDQTGLRDRCHLVTDSAQLHMSCRWISNTMGPAAILFWCGMLMDPKIRLRSCTDPCAAGSGHTRLQTSNKPCSTMQKVAPEPIKKLKYVEICWNMLKYVEIIENPSISAGFHNETNISSWCSSELNFFRSKLGRFASGASLSSSSSSSSSSSRLMVLSWAAWRTSWRKRRTWRSGTMDGLMTFPYKLLQNSEAYSI